MAGESKSWILWIDLMISALITDHMKRHPHNGFHGGTLLGVQIFVKKDDRGAGKSFFAVQRKPVINGHPGGVGPYGPNKDDTSPTWDNIVRAYEDCR